MHNFNEYLEEQEIKKSIITIAYMLEQYDSNQLTESVENLQEGLSDMMKKFGIHAHKSDGLLTYLARFTKGAGKMLMAAIKGDKETVKKLANTEISKEELIDILLKLDTLTLHMVTGPIHMIDALTGWHIGAAVKHAAAAGARILDKIKKIYNELKTTAKAAFKKAPEKIKAINDLEPIISYDV